MTTGNNADTFVDTDGDDKPDKTNTETLEGGRAFDANGDFDFPFGDGTVSMDPRQFRAASVTNLFYSVNLAHDFYYSLGFTETAGNFQKDNFGKGGLGGDPIISEGQQAYEINNATFSSPPDGLPGTMRVGLIVKDEANPTGDLDYHYSIQVVFHEYGHGVSSRLVGSHTSSSCLTGQQSQAMSEGWSDYFAISYTGDPVMEAYGYRGTTGIRRQSYERYPYTFEDLVTFRVPYEVHADGEIWTATLWDLRKLLGKQVTDQLVLNGLKSTPCKPTMIDARDGILTADQATYAGANRASIWQIFAKHGMGFSASAVNGSTATGLEYDAAYDMPPDLQPLKNPAITSKPLEIIGSLNAPYVYPIAATNPNKGVLKYTLSSGPDGMTVDPNTGVVNWVGSFTNQRVKITVTDGAGGKVVHGFYLPVFTTLNVDSPVTVAGTPFSVGYASVTVPAGLPVLQFTTRGGSGDSDLIVRGPVTNVSQRTDLNDETISYVAPPAGIYQIEVHGSYSDVRLLAASITPTPIEPDSTLSRLSGLEGSETMYVVNVPDGTASLTVSTSGGTGDVDLYVRQGSPTACQTYLYVLEDCVFDSSSMTDGNNESVTVSKPTSGPWYIDLSGASSYAGVTMTVDFGTRPPASPNRHPRLSSGKLRSMDGRVIRRP